MNTDEILEHLADEEVDSSRHRDLSISSRVLRVPALELVAVGGEQPEMTQIGAYLDALHWQRWGGNGNGQVKLVVGSGERTQSVLSALALLQDAANEALIKVSVDFRERELPIPELDGMSERRLQQLQNRENANLPDLACNLERMVNDSCFFWSRTLSSPKWSGRVDGLEICAIDDRDLGACIVKLGNAAQRRQGQDREANQWLREVLGEADERQFGAGDVTEAGRVIQQLAASRRDGALARIQSEHKLEARICRQAIHLNCLGLPLEPVTTQFPAVWSTQRQAKYIDLLMANDGVPWVVELKVPGSGQGRDYRKAVAQAVLYREFIRRAKGLHPWFTANNMNASRCQSAVAFPLSGTTRDRQRIRRQIQYLADHFDVEVIVIPDNWDEPDL